VVAPGGNGSRQARPNTNSSAPIARPPNLRVSSAIEMRGSVDSAISARITDSGWRLAASGITAPSGVSRDLRQERERDLGHVRNGERRGASAPLWYQPRTHTNLTNAPCQRRDRSAVCSGFREWRASLDAPRRVRGVCVGSWFKNWGACGPQDGGG